MIRTFEDCLAKNPTGKPIKCHGAAPLSMNEVFMCAMGLRGSESTDLATVVMAKCAEEAMEVIPVEWTELGRF
eukprot:5244166-Pyramimonas_sp.AAC.1